MTTADDLMTSAQRLYRISRAATDPAVTLRLVNLADDYVRQANELRHEEERVRGEHRPQNELARPPL